MLERKAKTVPLYTNDVGGGAHPNGRLGGNVNCSDVPMVIT